MDELRLAELKRQRELVREHLEWLDATIAAAEDAPTAPATQRVTPAVEQVPPKPKPEATHEPYLLSREASQAQEVASTWQAGCVMAAVLATLLFIGVFFWPLPQLIYR
ncbi:MAG: hypothetical protein Q7P63_03530 [Verrucomicrobiota bacterium JB022]|nr:hypothetical protein [Verrucomicrobiota bacterium JB022]